MVDFDTISGVLASSVATSATFTTGFPTGSRLGDHRSGKSHYLWVDQQLYRAPTDFTVAFTNATTITVT
jgi:hypothetical protein